MLGQCMLDATAHFEAVRDRLPGGPEVLQARKTALARAEQNGLPTRRNENWHYTDLARLLKQNQATPVLANAFDAGALSPLQMMFENGVLINEPASDDCASIESLAGALAGRANHETTHSDNDMAAFNLPGSRWRGYDDYGTPARRWTVTRAMKRRICAIQ